jgi:phosphate acetyltransferase
MIFRERIRERVKAVEGTVVLVEGWDERIQQAAQIIRDGDLCEVIVLSKNPEVDATVREVADLLAERKPDRVANQDAAIELARDPLRLGAGMVSLGKASGAVAGATCPTADVLRAALWAVGPKEGMKTVSSSFYMVLPRGSGADWWGQEEETILTVTDAAVVPNPDSQQMAEIALAASNDRGRIVGDTPVVAFLSYSTKGSAAGEMVDKVVGAVAAFRSLGTDVVCDGELQIDAALVPHVAASKAAGSPVAGRANVLVFPDLNAGNMAYKLIQRIGGAAAVGPILQGLAKPVADLSRGASADDIVDVACISVLQSSASVPSGV